MNVIVPSGKIEKYGFLWPKTKDPLSIEMDMVTVGGEKKKKDGTICGKGLLYHFKQVLSIIWPEINWNHWSELQVECWVKYRIIGQIGCASSGKTFVPSACLLADYYIFPSITTGLVSSTTRESLEMRILGEVKRLHRLAKERYHWIPGHLIEGRQRIVTDPKSEASEGRDFRNGILGVACKRGQSFQGIEEYVGIKNKRLRLLADELQFLPRVFVDSISNLNKNTDFKTVCSGNPKDITDALGVLCEPSAALGGWDSGIDQQPKTKTWEIRFPKGICIQFPGSDSPNLDGKLGVPLITQEQIDADIAFYGKDSIQYCMMDEGRMPRGQGNRRVITRQLALKFHAMDEPVWDNSNKTKIAFLDAAYRGVGGDRCVFGELDFGDEVTPLDSNSVLNGIINQTSLNPRKRQILALVDTMVVPILMDSSDSPEDQIVNFVKRQCEQRGISPENFYFDSGMRTSLVSAFSRLWSPSVNSIDCGGSPSEEPVSSDISTPCNKYYSKKITEIWYNVRMTVEAGQFRGMTEEVLSEFSQREWCMVQGNKIEVEGKKAMKLKTGRSPDLADAVAIGVYGARLRGFFIKRPLAPESKKVEGSGWKNDLKQKAQQFWRSGDLVRT